MAVQSSHVKYKPIATVHTGSSGASMIDKLQPAENTKLQTQVKTPHLKDYVVAGPSGHFVVNKFSNLELCEGAKNSYVKENTIVNTDASSSGATLPKKPRISKERIEKKTNTNDKVETEIKSSNVKDRTVNNAEIGSNSFSMVDKIDNLRSLAEEAKKNVFAKKQMAVKWSHVKHKPQVRTEKNDTTSPSKSRILKLGKEKKTNTNDKLEMDIKSSNIKDKTVNNAEFESHSFSMVDKTDNLRSIAKEAEKNAFAKKQVAVKSSHVKHKPQASTKAGSSDTKSRAPRSHEDKKKDLYDGEANSTGTTLVKTKKPRSLRSSVETKKYTRDTLQTAVHSSGSNLEKKKVSHGAGSSEHSQGHKSHGENEKNTNDEHKIMGPFEVIEKPPNKMPNVSVDITLVPKYEYKTLKFIKNNK